MTYNCRLTNLKFSFWHGNWMRNRCANSHAMNSSRDWRRWRSTVYAVYRLACPRLSKNWRRTATCSRISIDSHSDSASMWRPGKEFCQPTWQSFSGNSSSRYANLRFWLGGSNFSNVTISVGYPETRGICFSTLPKASGTISVLTTMLRRGQVCSMISWNTRTIRWTKISLKTTLWKMLLLIKLEHSYPKWRNSKVKRAYYCLIIRPLNRIVRYIVGSIVDVLFLLVWHKSDTSDLLLLFFFFCYCVIFVFTRRHITFYVNIAILF